MGLALFGARGAVAAKDGKTSEDPQAESLAHVLLFYSEPPLAFEPGEEIEVPILSTWDRDRMERELRQHVAKAGGDMMIVTRSYMSMDRDPQLLPRPPARAGAPPIYTLDIPKKTIYAVGRVGKLIPQGPPGVGKRSYPLAFPDVWNAALDVLDKLGWKLESTDTESRYVLTKPIVGAAPAMECENRELGWRAVTFAIYFGNYLDETVVRIDVTFLDPSTGEPSACRSVGIYERQFLNDLSDRLGLGPMEP